MRKVVAICAGLALSLVAAPAVGGGHTRLALHASDDGAERVLRVETKGNGPVHRHLTLALDKAAVVELDADARDVLVSDPAVVDAVVRAPRRIFLLAQKIGEANAFFFDAQGRQLLAVDIRVEKDVGDLSSMIRSEIPGANVHVESLNGNVVLSGSVESQHDATRAADIATRFAADPDKSGEPPKLVNMLHVKSGEQVMLKVRVAEMQRQIAKQFGFNVAAGGLVGSVPMALATDNQFALLGRALSDISGAQVGQVCQQGTTPFNGPCTFQNPADATLKALERVGLVHTLAEPNLTAVSGETAKFLAGGEFPVPTSRDLYGNITITFKQFGVGLSFTPVVLGPGRISLQISSEVSELTNVGAFTQAATTSTDTNGNTVTNQGVTIPALDVRRAETTVELPSGGSFAIAGLMQHTTKQTIDAFPGLKEMPVLGALFRSRDFENDETELVVIVSAYLVSPTSEGKFASPTDGFRPASDIDTILNGKINAVQTPEPPAPANALSQGSTGYIVR
ncbi:MAG: type II and III secretion system protein family protein [Alphaproteobacteria bacterium]|nr:type II and III secretion system protein family protein [Alphaproteobacteria bacterium]